MTRAMPLMASGGPAGRGLGGLAGGGDRGRPHAGAACGDVALHLDRRHRRGAGGVFRGPLVGRTAGGNRGLRAGLDRRRAAGGGGDDGRGCLRAACGRGARPASVADPVWAITALTALAFFLPSFFAGVPAPVLAQIAVTTQEAPAPRWGRCSPRAPWGRSRGRCWRGSSSSRGWVDPDACGRDAGLRGLGPPVLLAGAVARAPAGRCRRVVATTALAGFALSAPPQCQVESRYFCLRVEVLSPDPGEPRAADGDRPPRPRDRRRADA
jgi:hypothetical protein